MHINELEFAFFVFMWYFIAHSSSHLTYFQKEKHARYTVQLKS